MAEDQALAYLQEKGMSLVTRNFSCRSGEIDLIMKQSSTIVFVEVRYRKNSRYGSPQESVGLRKQRRIINCASYYLTINKINKAARFDVVAITPKNGTLDIDWIPDAFQT